MTRSRRSGGEGSQDPCGPSRRRALVVERDPAVRSLLERVLELGGWRVTAVGSPAAARSACAAGDFALVVDGEPERRGEFAGGSDELPFVRCASR